MHRDSLTRVHRLQTNTYAKKQKTGGRHQQGAGGGAGRGATAGAAVRGACVGSVYVCAIGGLDGGDLKKRRAVWISYLPLHTHIHKHNNKTNTTARAVAPGGEPVREGGPGLAAGAGLGHGGGRGWAVVAGGGGAGG